MFSPKKYLEEFIATQLNSFVSSVDESNLSVGLWNGDVSLTHLDLKTQTWSLGCGLWLSLAHGYVDHCRIQIPWAQLHSGRLSLHCNELNIVLRLYMDDSIDTLEDGSVTAEIGSRRQQAEALLHSIKMELVEAEEKKTFEGTPTDASKGQKGWLQNSLQFFASSYLQRLTSTFSFSVRGVKLSVLIPTLQGHFSTYAQHSHRSHRHTNGQLPHSVVHIAMDSLDVHGQDPKHAVPTSKAVSGIPQFCKDVVIRGLSLSVGSTAPAPPPVVPQSNKDKRRGVSKRKSTLSSTQNHATPAPVAMSCFTADNYKEIVAMSSSAVREDSICQSFISCQNSQPIHSKEKNARRKPGCMYHPTLLSPTNIVFQVAVVNDAVSGTMQLDPLSSTKAKPNSEDSSDDSEAEEESPEKSADADHTVVVKQNLRVKVQSRNFEATPSVVELKILQDISNFGALYQLRNRFASFRCLLMNDKNSSSSSGSSLARRRWVFAITAVLHVIRENNKSTEVPLPVVAKARSEEQLDSFCGLVSLDAPGRIFGSAHRQWICMRQYTLLYRKSIEEKFHLMTTDMRPSDDNEGGSTAQLLSPETINQKVLDVKRKDSLVSMFSLLPLADRELLVQLDMVLSHAELVRCRCTVQASMLHSSVGISSSTLKTLVFNTPIASTADLISLLLDRVHLLDYLSNADNGSTFSRKPLHHASGWTQERVVWGEVLDSWDAYSSPKDSLDNDILEALAKMDINAALATGVESKENSLELSFDVNVARMACSVIEPVRPISSASVPACKAKEVQRPRNTRKSRSRSGTQERSYAPFSPKVPPSVPSSSRSNSVSVTEPIVQVPVVVQRAKLFTFVCYGIYTSFISEKAVTDYKMSNSQNELEDQFDLTLVFRVACIRAYGTLAGNEILSVGVNPSAWSDSIAASSTEEDNAEDEQAHIPYDPMKIHDSSSRSLAMSLVFQLRHMVVNTRQDRTDIDSAHVDGIETIGESDDESPSAGKPMDIVRQHHIIEFEMAVVHLLWDQATALVVRNLLLSLGQPHSIFVNLVSKKVYAQSEQISKYQRHYKEHVSTDENDMDEELEDDRTPFIQRNSIDPHDIMTPFTRSMANIVSITTLVNSVPKCSVDVTLQGICFNLPHHDNRDQNLSKVAELVRHYSTLNSHHTGHHGDHQSDNDESSCSSYESSSDDYNDDYLFDNDEIDFGLMSDFSSEASYNMEDSQDKGYLTHGKYRGSSQDHIGYTPSEHHHMSSFDDLAADAPTSTTSHHHHHKHNSTMLQLKFGRVSMQGGDFLESMIPSATFEDNDNDESGGEDYPLLDYAHDESTTVSWDRSSAHIVNLVQSLRCPLVHPLIFSIDNVEFRVVDRVHSEGHQYSSSQKSTSSSGSSMPYALDSWVVLNSLTDTPWCIKAVISYSELPYYRNYANQRLDIFLSPLNVTISPQDILMIIDSTFYVTDVFSLPTHLRHKHKKQTVAEPATKAEWFEKHVLPSPRIKQLAKLIQLHLHVHFDSFKLSFASEKKNTFGAQQTLIAAILRTYGKQYVSTGSREDSKRVLKTYKKLTQQRLINAGLTRADSDAILSRFIVNAHPKSVPKESDTSSTTKPMNPRPVERAHDERVSGDCLEKSVVTETAEILSILYSSDCPAETHATQGATKGKSSHLPMFEFRVAGLHLFLEQLSYDYRLLFNMQELRLVDEIHNPIVLIYVAGNNGIGNAPNFNATSSNAHAYDFEKDKPVPSAQALTFSYMESDSKWEWGEGGHSCHAFHCPVHSQFYSSRKGEVALHVDSMDNFLSREGVPRVVEQVLPSINRVKSHWKFMAQSHAHANVANATATDVGSSTAGQMRQRHGSVGHSPNHDYVSPSPHTVPHKQRKYSSQGRDSGDSNKESQQVNHVGRLSFIRSTLSPLISATGSSSISRGYHSFVEYDAVVELTSTVVVNSHCHVHKFSSLLSDNDHMLAELRLESINVSLSPEKLTKAYSSYISEEEGENSQTANSSHFQSSSRALQFSVDTVKLYDMSTGGSLHTQAVWKVDSKPSMTGNTYQQSASKATPHKWEPSSTPWDHHGCHSCQSDTPGSASKSATAAMGRAPAMSVNFTIKEDFVRVAVPHSKAQLLQQHLLQEDSATVKGKTVKLPQNFSVQKHTSNKVNLKVQDVGICVLSRFCQELVLFITEKIVSPLTAAVNKNNDEDPDFLDESSMQREEKNEVMEPFSEMDKQLASFNATGNLHIDDDTILGRSCDSSSSYGSSSSYSSDSSDSDSGDGSTHIPFPVIKGLHGDVDVIDASILSPTVPTAPLRTAATNAAQVPGLPSASTAAANDKRKPHLNASQSEDALPSEVVFWSFKVSFENLTVIVPRNSSSNDLVGITLDCGSYSSISTLESWPSPRLEAIPVPPTRPGDSPANLHFDPYRNKWTFSALEPIPVESISRFTVSECAMESAMSASMNGNNAQSKTEVSFHPHQSDNVFCRAESSPMPISTNPGTMTSLFGRFGDDTPDEYGVESKDAEEEVGIRNEFMFTEALGLKKGSSLVKLQEALRNSDTSTGLNTSDDDDDLFFDAVEDDSLAIPVDVARLLAHKQQPMSTKSGGNYSFETVMDTPPQGTCVVTTPPSTDSNHQTSVWTSKADRSFVPFADPSENGSLEGESMASTPAHIYTLRQTPVYHNKPVFKRDTTSSNQHSHAVRSRITRQLLPLYTPPSKAEFERHIVVITSMSIFASLSGALPNQCKEAPDYDSKKIFVIKDERRNFLNVKDLEPVYRTHSHQQNQGKNARYSRNPRYHGAHDRHHTDRESDVEGTNGKRNGADLSKIPQQKWRKLSVTPFNLTIVVDNGPSKSRILFSDSATLCPISFKVSMSEFYLLLSLYFDNMFELPQFLSESVKEDTTMAFTEGLTIQIPKVDTTHNPEPLPMSGTASTPADPSILYGSNAYCDYIRNRIFDSEIIVVCAELSFDCSMDVDYFPINPASLPSILHPYLASLASSDASTSNTSEMNYDTYGSVGGPIGNKTSGTGEHDASGVKKWDGVSLPVAVIRISRWTCHIRSDDDVTQVALGVGCVEIVDIRNPSQTSQPVVAYAAPYSTVQEDSHYSHTPQPIVYGYADFDFGLSYDPSIINTILTQDIPLKLTAFVSNSFNWTTTNIGLDYANLTVKNCDMIFLLADYFSLYFSTAEFGHPGVLAYKNLPKDLVPYGGVDTRLFATRPHIIVLEKPLRNELSQSIHLETAFGVYYRHTTDVTGSVKMEINATDLALVIHKNAKLASEARGLRGAAGSGKGIRTQVEFLSCSFVYHLDAILNHVDTSLIISPNESADGGHGRVSANQTETTTAIAAAGGGSDGAVGSLPTTTVVSSDDAINLPAGNRMMDKTFLTDLNYKQLVLHPIPVKLPLCIYPLTGNDRRFTEDSCDLVTSYEDLLLTVSLISCFIPATESNGSEEECADSGKDRSNTSGSDITPPRPVKKGVADDKLHKKRKSYTKSNRGVLIDEENDGYGAEIDRDTEPSTSNIVGKTGASRISCFTVIRVDGVRAVVVDNVLGMHLPLAQAFIQNLDVTLENKSKEVTKTVDVDDRSKDNTHETDAQPARPNQLQRASSLSSQMAIFSADGGADPVGFHTPTRSTASSVPSHKHGSIRSETTTSWQVVSSSYTQARFWVDYFNNALKCWEPFLEPLTLTLYWEQSPKRGQGITMRFGSALHVNLTGALLRALNDTLRMVLSANCAAESNELAAVEDELATKEPRSQVMTDVDESTSSAAVSVAHGSNISSPTLMHAATTGRIRSGSGVKHVVGLHHSNSTGTIRTDGTRDSAGLLPKDVVHVPGKSSRSRRMSSFAPGTNSANSSVSNAKAPLPFLMEHHRSKSAAGLHSAAASGSLVNTIEHILFHSIEHMRVGFSILNITGQSLRYLQGGDGEFATSRKLQYIAHGQRGVLNFVASSTLIRNNQVFEEEFNLQRDVMQTESENYGNQSNNAMQRMRVGHQVALQVCGYNWLPAVQADTLGVKYEDIKSVLGRVCLRVAYNKKVSKEIACIKNAVKLVTEVLPYNGGRELVLRSVITVKNCTNHSLKILANPSSKSNSPDESAGDPFLVEVGGNFHVPIALLQQSILQSNGRSLGHLFFRPAELTPVSNELLVNRHMKPGGCSYTKEPINLLKTITKACGITSMSSGDAPSATTSSSNSEESDNDFMQLCCQVHPKPHRRMDDNFNNSRNTEDYAAGTANDTAGFNAPLGQSSRLPPFCYSIEVQRFTSDSTSAAVQSSLTAKTKMQKFVSIAGKLFASKEDVSGLTEDDPSHYVISVHPPIVLENLLPTGGKFTIIHAIHQTVMWSAWIGAGMQQPIHTVTLNEPLALLINLKYCRTTPEGTLIHSPINMKTENVGIAQALQHTIEGFLDEAEHGDASVILTDTVGQRLRLNVQNTQGEGGQRHIAVYAPYWIVNTSQYAIRLREEGDNTLPAGSVTPLKNGTRAVADADNLRSNQSSRSSAFGISKRGHDIGEGTVYPGLPGQLHSSTLREIPEKSHLRKLLKELPFEDIIDWAYMFNFREDARLLVGKRMIVVQLDDSEWSVPFSPDSAGVSQSIVIDHPEKGILELGFQTELAPGRLAKLTKIVRFSPRFVVVNRLPVSVRLLQSSEIVGKTKEVNVSSNHLKLFHLPALYGERKLSIQVEGPYNPMVAFDIDQIGTYNLSVPPRYDLASLPHVDSRGSAEYVHHLPSQELGIYFETDWTLKDVVVKGCKAGSYAEKNTEIHTGDVIVAIDGASMSGIPFEEVMIELKAKLATGDGVDVTFRTVEEKLRLVRRQILQKSQMLQHSGGSGTTTVGVGGTSLSVANTVPFPTAVAAAESATSSSTFLNSRAPAAAAPTSTQGDIVGGEIVPMTLNVDLRAVESTVFIFISSKDPDIRPEYIIENKTAAHSIYYKQKGLIGIRWKLLLPGRAATYIFDDPFRPHKLLVRVGRNVVCPDDRGGLTNFAQRWKTSSAAAAAPIDFLPGFGSDNYTVSISLDDLGKSEQLPIPNSNNCYCMSVSSIGPTKSLCISPPKADLLNEYKHAISVSAIQIKYVKQLEEYFKNQCKPRKARAAKYALPANDVELHFTKCMTSIQHDLDVLRDSEIEMENEGEDRATIFQSLVGNTAQLRTHFAKQVTLQHLESEAEPMSLPTTPMASKQVNTGVIGEHYCSFPMPIKSTMGLIIDRTHQLMVDVLEAREVKPLVSSGRKEDLFCKCYLKSPDDTIWSAGNRQHQYTYVCEQNQDPSWFGQKFLFNVSDNAAEEIRGFHFRVVVRCTTLLGITHFLGQADVHFSCLKNEEEVCGWFPLRPSVAATASLPAADTIESYGSIKLRLHWVKSDSQLAHYLSKTLNKRVKELERHVAVIENLVDTIDEENPLRLQRTPSSRKLGPSSASTTAVSSSHIPFNKPRLKRQLSQRKRGSTIALDATNAASSKVPFSAIDESTGGEEKHDMPTLKGMTSIGRSHHTPSASVSGIMLEQERMPMEVVELDSVSQMLLKQMSVRRSSHVSHMANWANGIRHNLLSKEAQQNVSSEETAEDSSLHSFELPRNRLGSYVVPSLTATNSAGQSSVGNKSTTVGGAVLQRRKSSIIDNTTFSKNFEKECYRNYVHSHATTGRLEITPIQALNLIHSLDLKYVRPMLVKITYGDIALSTFSISAATDLTWLHLDPIVSPANGEDGDECDQTFKANDATYPTNTTASVNLAANVGNATKTSVLEVLTKSFYVNTLNVNGNLKVQVMAENFPTNKEIAVVELPMFNILDCCCLLGPNQIYDRWFPMLLSKECIPSEGQVNNFNKSIKSEKVSPNHASFGDIARCIRLQMKWRPDLVPTEKSKFYSRLQLPEMSVAIVDSSHARELVQVSVSDTTVRSFVTDVTTDTSANIISLQIDNQLPLPIAPVMLALTQKHHPQPAIRFHMKRNNLSSHSNLNSFDAIRMLVQEFDLRLEQQTVVATWELIQDWAGEIKHTFDIFKEFEIAAAKAPSSSSPHTGTSSSTGNPNAQSTENHSSSTSVKHVESTNLFGIALATDPSDLAEVDVHNIDDNKIYIENFQLFPIKIHISFIMTPQINITATGIATNASAATVTEMNNRVAAVTSDSATNTLMSALSTFLWQVGEVVLDLTSAIDNAPIILNGLYVPNLFETESKLMSILQGHYLSSALRQLYKIAGSLELVGNPIGLISSLGVGVRDFFYEPATAFISNPTEFGRFGRSVMKGTLALVSNTAEGMIGTGTTITRSAGRGIATLLMDQAFMTSRQELQRLPNEPIAILSRPFMDIRNGVYYGVVGIIRVPYHSVKKFGAYGLVPGAANGIAGLVAKPVVGVLDAITHTGESFREGVRTITRSSQVPVTRRRLSNLFGPDGRVLPYLFSSALGTHILRVLDQAYREKFGVSSALKESVGLVRSGLWMSAGTPFRRTSKASADLAISKSDLTTRGPLGSRNSITSASQLNMDPSATDDMIINNNNEFVVFSCILDKSPGVDQVIIFSTARVVIADYRRERGGSYIKLVWQSQLSTMKCPLLQSNSGSGATLTLCSSEAKNVTRRAYHQSGGNYTSLSKDFLKYGKSTHFKPKNSSKSEVRPSKLFNFYSSTPAEGSSSSMPAAKGNSFVVVHRKFDVLRKVFNCLQTLKHQFYAVEHSGNDDYTTMDYDGSNEQDINFSQLLDEGDGVVRIGSWEYSLEMDNSSPKANVTTEFSKIKDSLFSAPWINFSGSATSSGCGKNPQWLVTECRESEMAHGSIEEVMDLLAMEESVLASLEKKESQDILRTAFKTLRDGRMSFAEFKIHMDTIQKQSKVHVQRKSIQAGMGLKPPGLENGITYDRQDSIAVIGLGLDTDQKKPKESSGGGIFSGAADMLLRRKKPKPHVEGSVIKNMPGYNDEDDSSLNTAEPEKSKNDKCGKSDSKVTPGGSNRPSIAEDEQSISKDKKMAKPHQKTRFMSMPMAVIIGESNNSVASFATCSGNASTRQDKERRSSEKTSKRNNDKSANTSSPSSVENRAASPSMLQRHFLRFGGSTNTNLSGNNESMNDIGVLDSEDSPSVGGGDSVTEVVNPGPRYSSQVDFSGIHDAIVDEDDSVKMPLLKESLRECSDQLRQSNVSSNGHVDSFVSSSNSSYVAVNPPVMSSVPVMDTSSSEVASLSITPGIALTGTAAATTSYIYAHVSSQRSGMLPPTPNQSIVQGNHESPSAWSSVSQQTVDAESYNAVLERLDKLEKLLMQQSQPAQGVNDLLLREQRGTAQSSMPSSKIPGPVSTSSAVRAIANTMQDVRVEADSKSDAFDVSDDDTDGKRAATGSPIVHDLPHPAV